jgi:hypothetical protein
MEYKHRKVIVDTAHDLLHLQKTVENIPSPHEVRRSTPILRNLLLQNQLNNSWRLLGFDGAVYIETNTVFAEIKPTIEDEVAIAPARRGGVVEVQGLSFTAAPASIGRSYALPVGVPNRFKLSKFLDSSGMFLRGSHISRKIAIEFACDKRGGAHLDYKIRSKDHTRSMALLAEVYDPKPTTVGEYSFEVSFTNYGLRPLERYVLNTTQDLVDAPDIQKLIARARELFPSEIN